MDKYLITKALDDHEKRMNEKISKQYTNLIGEFNDNLKLLMKTTVSCFKSLEGFVKEDISNIKKALLQAEPLTAPLPKGIEIDLVDDNSLASNVTEAKNNSNQISTCKDGVITKSLKELNFKNTYFLRQHAHRHNIINASRMLKTQIVEEIVKHYSVVHSVEVIQDEDPSEKTELKTTFFNTNSSLTKMRDSAKENLQLPRRKQEDDERKFDGKDQSYECNYSDENIICTYVTTDRMAFVNHKKVIHKGTRIEEEKKAESTKSEAQMKPFMCQYPKCDSTFSKRQSLQDHVQGMHKGLKRQTSRPNDSIKNSTRNHDSDADQSLDIKQECPDVLDETSGSETPANAFLEMSMRSNKGDNSAQNQIKNGVIKKGKVEDFIQDLHKYVEYEGTARVKRKLAKCKICSKEIRTDDIKRHIRKHHKSYLIDNNMDETTKQLTNQSQNDLVDRSEIETLRENLEEDDTLVIDADNGSVRKLDDSSTNSIDIDENNFALTDKMTTNAKQKRRIVECGYCRKEMRRDKIKSHIRMIHGSIGNDDTSLPLENPQDDEEEITVNEDNEQVSDNEEGDTTGNQYEQGEIEVEKAFQDFCAFCNTRFTDDYELHQHRTKKEECNPTISCNDCQDEMALANFVEHQANSNCSPTFLRVVLPVESNEEANIEQILDKMDTEEA